MSVFDWVAAVVCIALLVYLFFVLLFPEDRT